MGMKPATIARRARRPCAVGRAQRGQVGGSVSLTKRRLATLIVMGVGTVAKANGGRAVEATAIVWVWPPGIDSIADLMVVAPAVGSIATARRRLQAPPLGATAAIQLPLLPPPPPLAIVSTAYLSWFLE